MPEGQTHPRTFIDFNHNQKDERRTDITANNSGGVLQAGIESKPSRDRPLYYWPHRVASHCATSPSIYFTRGGCWGNRSILRLCSSPVKLRISSASTQAKYHLDIYLLYTILQYSTNLMRLHDSEILRCLDKLFFLNKIKFLACQDIFFKRFFLQNGFIPLWMDDMLAAWLTSYIQTKLLNWRKEVLHTMLHTKHYVLIQNYYKALWGFYYSF